MSHVGRGYDINQTFIIQGEPTTGGTDSISACTAVYTNALESCSGDTKIFLGSGLITFDGNLYTNDNLSASTINASTYYSGGTNLFDIISLNNITGGTFNSNTDTLTLLKENNSSVVVTGFTDFYTTGATLIGNTVYFDRNDLLSAYTLSLSAFSSTDIYTTGVTFNNNQLIIVRNDGVSLNTFINTFTGLTVNGLLTANSISANTISATTFYGDGSNLSGISNSDTFVTGGTYFQGNTTFTNNTGGTFNIIGPSNYNAGVISGATWTNNNNGSISLPELKVGLFDNSDYIEPLKFYTISSGTTGVGGLPGLTDNDTNYIIIEYNSGSPRYNVLNNSGTVNGSDVLLYMIVYRIGNFVHTLEFGNQGAGMPNKITERILNTDRFARESGFELGLSGSTGVVEISAGVSWNGIYRQQLNAVNSVDDEFFKLFHSGGTWTYTLTGTTLNNTFYDDGTDVVSATTGNYLVNWYFRGQEIGNHIYEVYGNDEYTSVSDAEASAEPMLPELVTSHAFLVGRIIVGVGLTTGITQSAFSTVFQPSGAAGIHNDLLNIQGGAPNEYYHLSSNEYNNLAYTNVDNNFNIGQTFNNGLTATTISATTYLGLPIDIRVTGGTYSNGTAIFTNNTGGTFNVSGLTTGDTYWVSGSTGNFSLKTINDSGLDSTGDYALAEGYGTTANGNYSHAEGWGSIASGEATHAEGGNTIASDLYAHAEGYGSIASARISHAEGFETTASGGRAHSEGQQTTASGLYSHAEGYLSIASARISHAEGSGTTASGDASHAEGGRARAFGQYSHAQNLSTYAIGNYSHAEGDGTTAGGAGSHAGGAGSIASGVTSFIHSTNSIVTGDRSVVLGGQNITGNTADTVYVPRLNVKFLSGGTTVNNVGIDSNGFLVVGTTGGGGTFDYGLSFAIANAVYLT